MFSILRSARCRPLHIAAAEALVPSGFRGFFFAPGRRSRNQHNTPSMSAQRFAFELRAGLTGSDGRGPSYLPLLALCNVAFCNLSSVVKQKTPGRWPGVTRGVQDFRVRRRAGDVAARRRRFRCQFAARGSHDSAQRCRSEVSECLRQGWRPAVDGVARS